MTNEADTEKLGTDLKELIRDAEAILAGNHRIDR